MNLRKMALVASVSVVALLATACGSSQSGTTAQVPADAQKVTVTASNFKWTLSQTTFQAGKPIDFVVSSTEGTHGFSIVQTKVSQSISDSQKPMDVVWTPPGPGTYTIRCDIYCGSGHPNMYTSFVVK